MAAPLCIHTKQDHQQAIFGLGQCLKDQQGRSDQQVDINHCFNFQSKNILFVRNSN